LECVEDGEGGGVADVGFEQGGALGEGVVELGEQGLGFGFVEDDEELGKGELVLSGEGLERFAAVEAERGDDGLAESTEERELGGLGGGGGVGHGWKIQDRRGGWKRNVWKMFG